MTIPTLYELRNAAFESLLNLQKAIHQLQNDMYPTSHTHSNQTPSMTFSSSLFKDATELRKMIEGAHKVTKQFMNEMKNEHSEAFATEEMKQYLQVCEQLLVELPLVATTSKQIAIQEGDNYGSLKQDLVNSLKQDVEQINEQQLANQSKQVRWSIF